jgi:predicted metal-binding protein
LDAKERHRPADVSEAAAAAYAIVEDARRPMDARLLEAEKRHHGSRALFAGSCLLCGRGGCLRTEGKPCRYPDRARTSLEACGFDVARTAKELLGLPLRWSEGPVLPPYFTLVGGLFTKEKTEESEWTHA